MKDTRTPLSAMTSWLGEWRWPRLVQPVGGPDDGRLGVRVRSVGAADLDVDAGVGKT